MPRKLVKERKYHFIYKTTNKLSGKYYIGMHSTDNLKDGYLGSGTRLGYSIRKHGKENHKREILEFCNSREELIKREVEIVNLNEIAKEECINLKVGGSGGMKGVPIETVKRIGSLGGKAFAENRKTNIEMDSKMKLIAAENFRFAHKNGKIPYNNFKEKTHTEETKRKIGLSNSINQKGKRNSQYGKVWIFNTTEKKSIKIDKSLINDFVADGWKLGRKIKF